MLRRLFFGYSAVWKAFAASRRGPRPDNQDNFLVLGAGSNKRTARFLSEQTECVLEVPGWPAGWLRLAVMDGMGGHSHGRAISEAIARELMDVPPLRTLHSARDAVLALHTSLYDRFSNGGERNPGSTLLMADLAIPSGKGILVNVGDSRAIVIGDNSWRRTTHDHTALEFAYRDVEITQKEFEDQVDYGPRPLAQAVGYGSMGLLRDPNGHKPFRFSKGLRLDLPTDLPRGMAEHADIKPFRLKADEILLLATDGLWSNGAESVFDEMVHEKMLCQAAVDRLTENSMMRGAKDNVTVAVCGPVRREK
jgi:serine/threonine protein phosphatase PrpC